MLENTFIAILAGGKGERLWPLSRNKQPKQLLAFTHQKSLLEHTIDRISGIVPNNNILIITNQEQKKLIEPIIQFKNYTIFTEPEGRNTGPAVILTSLHLASKNSRARVIFIPADHYIKEDEFLSHCLLQLAKRIDPEYLYLLGVNPSYPATGYGYIEYEKDAESIDKNITRFHEKPNREQASYYCMQSNFLWNIGIFAGFAQTFLIECEKTYPELLKTIANYYNTSQGYDKVPNISFDHAVLEKCHKALVLPVNITWSDIGNLESFLSLGEHADNNVLEINASGNIINKTDKLVALIGVHDLCIVETDDVLLVVKKDNTESVKNAVNLLKGQARIKYL